MLNNNPNAASRRIDPAGTSTWFRNNYDSDDSRESSEASNFFWKAPRKVFVLREPKLKLASIKKLLTTQQRDIKTMHIIVAKSEGRQAY